MTGTGAAILCLDQYLVRLVFLWRFLFEPVVLTVNREEIRLKLLENGTRLKEEKEFNNTTS